MSSMCWQLGQKAMCQMDTRFVTRISVRTDVEMFAHLTRLTLRSHASLSTSPDSTRRLPPRINTLIEHCAIEILAD
jgi:hypothetical protein